ncbi:ABC transporter G family member 23-like [Chironomus tepperi]|uniref:ABC transporter G family member 23-like n=1 Tax=Chironomus tepperi TaxID=113505 RepID=UPI00391F520C
MNCIEVRNVFKSYKGHGETVNVLDGLTLTVGYGEIFSLIGASGCGKTTLFTCLMGIQQVDKGELRIFNHKVSHNKSSKNYHAIGYMPQQTALIPELTIEETLQYFGDLFMMNPKELDQRIHEVIKLLDLPNRHFLIKNCSGGQRRRVSLAVAILHKPRLLLLDEPTVGLDYLLRETIWNFLKESALKFKITVVITTHYIDEANNSDRCGFIRNGKIIALDSPANILAQLDCETLDEAFYRLSLKDENHKIVFDAVDENVQEDEQVVDVLDRSRVNVVKALLKKEFNRIKRQPIEIFFLMLAPVIAINIAAQTLGTIRSNIQIGVVNNEIHDCSHNSTNSYISCLFIDNLDKKLNKNYYKKFDAAFEDLQEGRLKGIILIPENFTDVLYDDDLDIQKIEIYLDYGVYVEDLFLKVKVYEAFKSTAEHAAEDIDGKDIHTELMRFDYLYGTMDFNFKDSFGVAASFLMLFFLPMCYTSLIIYSHRIEGIWNRTLLSGVEISEILLSYLIFSIMYSMLQSLLFLITLYFEFSSAITADYWLLGLITISMTNLGFIIGILFSASFDNFHVIYGFGVWVCWVMIALCGFVWPTEAIHPIVRPIGEWSPITFAIKTFLNVYLKKMKILDPIIGFGLIYVFAWIFGVLVVVKILLNRRKFAREI